MPKDEQRDRADRKSHAVCVNFLGSQSMVACSSSLGYTVKLNKMLKFIKSKKFIVPITILLIILGTISYFSDRLKIVVPTKLYFSKNKTPGAYLIPVSRTLWPVKKEFKTSYNLSCNNFRFAVPWKLREKTELDRITVFAFVNKKGISISPLVKDEAILNGYLAEGPSEFQKTKLLFGEENLKSEYTFVNLILHTSPDHASILKPLRNLARIPPLLILKSIYSPLGDVIYKFRSENLKGFQFGNPQTTENVRVHVFNERGQVFKLHFVRATQDEIDHMLASIEFL